MRPVLVIAALALAAALPPAVHAQIRQQAVAVDGGRELIVRFRAGADAAERGAVRQAASTRVVRSSRLPGVQLVEVEAGTTPEAAIRALERDPDVVYAEPNARLQASAAIPNDPRIGELWGLRNLGQTIAGVPGTADADVDAELAWDLTVGSPNVLVAVVDSGVAWNHPDLAANIFTNGADPPGGGDNDGNGLVDDVRGWDFVGNDNNPYDLNDHGTHVAGTIAAVGNNGAGITGLTWSSKILPVRGLDGAGGGTVLNLANALDYAADMGARVVNGSFGGSGGAATLGLTIGAHPETLFVVAAGNAGSNNDGAPTYPCNLTLGNVICVAASDQYDELAGFSNFGASSVDLAAPGTSILSTRPHYDGVHANGFEAGAGGYTSGGSETWERTAEEAASGSFSLTDTQGVTMGPGENSYAATSPVSLLGRSGCHIDFALGIETEAGGDFLTVYRSVGGTDFEAISPAMSGSSDGFVPLSFYLDADGGNNVVVWLNLTSDADGNLGDGVHLDDVVIRCVGSGFTANDYQYLDGTSMATPHVAAAAALIVARQPTAPVAYVRDQVLRSGDVRLGLSGKTVTGRRLNAYNALNPLPSPPPPTPQPPAPPPPPPSPSIRLLTLAGVRASGCKVTGRGRRTKVSCRLSKASVIRSYRVRLTRRGRTVARASGRLGRRGTMNLAVKRRLRRGSYVLVIRLTATDGSQRTLRKTVRLS